jgi:hypothetical protein
MRLLIFILLLSASVAQAAPARWSMIGDDGKNLAQATSPTPTGPLSFMGNGQYVVFTHADGLAPPRLWLMEWPDGSNPIYKKNIKTYAGSATPLGVDFDGQYIWAYWQPSIGSETMDQIDPATGNVVKQQTVAKSRGGPIAFPRVWTDENEFVAGGSSVMYMVDRATNFALQGDAVEMNNFPGFAFMKTQVPPPEPIAIDKLYGMTHTGRFLVLAYRTSGKLHWYDYTLNKVVKTLSYNATYYGIAYNGHNYIIAR